MASQRNLRLAALATVFVVLALFLLWGVGVRLASARGLALDEFQLMERDLVAQMGAVEAEKSYETSDRRGLSKILTGQMGTVSVGNRWFVARHTYALPDGKVELTIRGQDGVVKRVEIHAGEKALAEKMRGALIERSKGRLLVSAL